MIFRKRNTNKQAADNDNPKDIRNHSAIKRIWRNTELSRDEFDACYLPILTDVINNARDDAEKDHILRLTSGVMVARGGFRLGKSLDIEDSDRIKNRFTLALVACVLVEIIAERDCAKAGNLHQRAYAPDLLQQKLGDFAFSCLRQTPVVFNDICAYFSDAKTSEIRAVIARYFTRTDNAQYRYLLPSFDDSEASDEQETDSDSAIKKEDDLGRKTSMAHQYAAWLNDGLSDRSITLNNVDSFAHLDAEGNLFLIETVALSDFAAAIDKKTEAVARNLVEKGFVKKNPKKRDYFKASVNGRSASGLIMIDAKKMLAALNDANASEHLVLVD